MVQWAAEIVDNHDAAAHHEKTNMVENTDKVIAPIDVIGSVAR
jgi:hypothetical protein